MIYALDTEDASDGQGARLIVVAGSGGTFHVWHSTDEFFRWLDSQRATIYCCNLEYDLGNLFRSLENQRQLLPLLRKYGIFAAKYRGVEFRDTLAQWPASVAEMGRSIGLDKMDAGGDFINEEYCKRDAEIVLKFVQAALSREKGQGIPDGYTAGSKCLKYFEKEIGLDFARHPMTGKMADEIRASYYGGRVECRRLGSVRGPIYSADINSAYPAAMTDPLPGPGLIRGGGFEGSAIWEGEVTTRAPSLPYRDSRRGLCFPVGRWWGFFPTEEVIYWQSRGVVSITRRGSRSWHTGVNRIDLSHPIRTLYEKRRASADPVERLALKVAMNSAYGKLGASRLMRHAVHYTRAKPEECGQPLRGGGFIVREVLSRNPRFSRPHIAAVITARVRIQLAEMMRKVEEAGGEVLYADTDAVHYRGAGRDLFPDTDALGGVKIEAEAKSAFYAGLKLYTLDGGKKSAAKGCPSREMAQVLRYIHGERVEGRRPARLLSKAAASGANLWTEYSRQITGDYLKGTIKNGVVQPLRISDII